MPVSQLDRKLLWARSHNRCAICKRQLTRRADSAERPGLVTGEEAHIVARSPTGPRGDRRDGVRIDSYDNLILLCPEDHKRIDDQPAAFPVARLHALKSEHERWAEDAHVDAPPPIRISAAADEDSVPLLPITSGRQLWDLNAGAHEWALSTLDESHSDEDIDLADAFLQSAMEWGEIAAEVEADGLQAVRSAQRDLTSLLKELWAGGIYVWGRRLRREMTGGVGEPIAWWHVDLVALTGEDLDDSEPVT